jgi:hypothetical protein
MQQKTPENPEKQRKNGAKSIETGQKNGLIGRIFNV